MENFRYKNPDFYIKGFHEAGKVCKLIFRNYKIVVPKSLQIQIV